MNEQKHVNAVLAMAENELASLNELGRDDADTQEQHDELAESYGKVYDLLKAAPDLLEALEGIRDSAREAAKHFRALGERGHAAICDAHADIADAAIAKARGQ